MTNKNRYYSIYGLNNAKAVLKSDNCRIVKIFLDNNSLASKDSEINELTLNDTYRKIIKSFNSVTSNDFRNNKRTQGIMIDFEFEGIRNSISDFFNQNNNDCIIILDQLEDPQNLGQIIRTCECFGVNKIILTYNKSVKLSNSVLQVSQGAFSDISFYICNNLRNTLNALKENNYWLVALENSIDAKNWYQIDLKGNIGIILGSEGKGIRRLTLEDSDFQATIPMQGKINSLNVSASCAAILSERLRQISNL